MKCSVKNVKVQPINTTVSTKPINDFDVLSWLGEQGEPYDYLLAHTFDGVVWGYRPEDTWLLSCDIEGAPSPPLITEELLELRLFGPSAEVFVWRGEGHVFHARTIEDAVDRPDQFQEYASYDEPQILWGTKASPLENGFVKMEDGSQGLAHAVPLPDVTEATDFRFVRPVQLCLRHYVQQDAESGMARVMMSRLFDLNYDEEAVKNGTQA